MDSIEKIKESVEEMESKLRDSALLYLGKSTQSALSFETILEWFFTWRIKMEDLKNTHWCDGVFDLSVVKEGKNQINFKGKAYIGPENNIDEIHESKFVGTITINLKTKDIEAYCFTLDVNNRIFKIDSKT